jgi:hypothetical protein
MSSVTCFAYLERAEQALVDTHHSTGIVKLATVIGRTEQRDQLTLGEELVAVFHNLMRTANQVHVMLLQKARDYVRAKSERHTAIVLTPAGNVLIRIGPQKIA